MQTTTNGTGPYSFDKQQFSNFFFARTCPAEIINIVNSAKTKKACSYDNIDPYVVQQVIPLNSYILTHSLRLLPRGRGDGTSNNG